MKECVGRYRAMPTGYGGITDDNAPRSWPGNGGNTSERAGPPRPKMVTEIMKDCMNVDLAAQIQDYMNGNPKKVWDSGCLNGAERFIVKRWSLLDSMIPATQWLGEVEVMLLVSARVEGIIPMREQEGGDIPIPPEGDGQSRIEKGSVLCLIQCTLDLRPCHQLCSKIEMSIAPQSAVYENRVREGMHRVGDLMRSESDGLMANLYLIPIMRQADYETAARSILKQYYPEALSSAISVSGDELVRRMGLTILEGRMRPDVQAMGFMYFTPTEADIWDEGIRMFRPVRIKPGTIVVNTALCKTYADRNSTLIHECMHIYLHRNFYMLQLAANPQWGYSAHRKRRRFAGSRLSPVDWSELQAQKLPAYILMPTETAKPEAEAFFVEFDGRRDVGTVRRAILYLSQLYKVSFSMAKYRMIELGFQEAEGIRGYMGNQPIPDHGCSGAWPEGCTFNISPKDAAELAAQDDAFAEALESGRYLYVEGHFCLKDSKYLSLTRGGYALTGYARSHMEECCIAFHVAGRSGGTDYRPAQAARNKKTPVTDRYHSRYEFVAEPGTEAQVREFRAFYMDANRWYELLNRLPDTTYEAVNAVLEAKGISQMELALRLDVDRKTLYRYLEKESPELRHVVAVCVALQLPGFVGRELVNTTNRRFSRSRKDNLLKIFLDSSTTMDIETCKTLFEEAGYGKLI